MSLGGEHGGRVMQSAEVYLTGWDCENYSCSSVGLESHQTSSSSRWVLFCISPLNAAPSCINRTVYGGASHISFGVLYFRAPPLRHRAPRAGGGKHSAANGQKRGQKRTVPTEKLLDGPVSRTLVCTTPFTALLFALCVVAMLALFCPNLKWRQGALINTSMIIIIFFYI